MIIRKLEDEDLKLAAVLAANFRVELSGFKCIEKVPDTASGEEELREYIGKGFPVFVAEDENKALAGYIVCKIDDGVLWAESLYVLPEYRGKGVASQLYDRAEELALELGNETVYNWVHPNNERMIGFLNKRGYDVLNLIEIRKKRSKEVTTRRIRIENNEFDY